MPYFIKPSKPPSHALLLWFLATVILPLISGSVFGSIHQEIAISYSIPFVLTSLVLLFISSWRLAKRDLNPLLMLLILGGLSLMFGMLVAGCMIDIPSLR